MPRTSWFAKFLPASAGIVVLMMGWRWVENRSLRSQMAALEQEKTVLHQYIERLCSARKVAQVRVVRQYDDPAGQPVSVLEWQEIGPGEKIGPPILVETVGRQIYFEGLVIKFLHDHVGSDHPGQNQSLVLFRRIFGDRQTPESAFPLGDLVPEESLSVGGAERPDLWRKFWELVENPQSAKKYGVRVAQCEAPAVPIRAGEIWEISLDASGGLNMCRIAQEQQVSNASP